MSSSFAAAVKFQLVRSRLHVLLQVAVGGGQQVRQRPAGVEQAGVGLFGRGQALGREALGAELIEQARADLLVVFDQQDLRHSFPSASEVEPTLSSPSNRALEGHNLSSPGFQPRAGVGRTTRNRRLYGYPPPRPGLKPISLHTSHAPSVCPAGSAKTEPRRGGIHVARGATPGTGTPPFPQAPVGAASRVPGLTPPGRVLSPLTGLGGYREPPPYPGFHQARAWFHPGLHECRPSGAPFSQIQPGAQTPGT